MDSLPIGSGKPILFDHIVIGAGPAGVAATRTLAQRTGPGKVALFGNEQHLPYERPALSKSALLHGVETTPNICSEADFANLGVTYVCADVTAISPADRQIETSAGAFAYGSLLLATGGAPMKLDVPGNQLPGVHYLRTAADAYALRMELQRRPRVAVIGGGFIGLEVAATARTMGCEVDVVTKGGHLMGRCMPLLLADAVAEMLEKHGVRFHFHAEPTAIESEGASLSVRLATGQRVTADVVVIGIGGSPATVLAAAAGLAVDDGVLVDRHWRTSDPFIYAAGDVARRRIDAPHRGIRLESWEPAIEHGRLAASAMLGDAVEEPGIPWMWSDQHEINIQIIGCPDPDDPMIVRTRADDGGLCAAFVDGNRIVGAITVNDGRSMTLLRRAITEGREVDLSAIADPSSDLRDALGIRRRAL